jgi:hypothetical protein
VAILWAAIANTVDLPPPNAYFPFFLLFLSFLLFFPSFSSFLPYSLQGGAMGIGNTGPVAEFNIQCDPEAAQLVLDTGLVTMVPLEVTHTALVTKVPACLASPEKSRERKK